MKHLPVPPTAASAGLEHRAAVATRPAHSALRSLPWFRVLGILHLRFWLSVVPYPTKSSTPVKYRSPAMGAS